MVSLLNKLFFVCLRLLPALLRPRPLLASAFIKLPVYARAERPLFLGRADMLLPAVGLRQDLFARRVKFRALYDVWIKKKAASDKNL